LKERIRVKYLKNKNYFLGELKKIKLPLLKFRVDSFKLKKSTLTPEGPIYEILEEYKAI
jgi:2'-5' RNA ligase